MKPLSEMSRRELMTEVSQQRKRQKTREIEEETPLPTANPTNCHKCNKEFGTFCRPVAVGVGFDRRFVCADCHPADMWSDRNEKKKRWMRAPDGTWYKNPEMS